MKKHTKKKIILLSVILASLVAMKAHANYYNGNYDANYDTSAEAEEYLTSDEIQLLEDINANDNSGERLVSEKEKLATLSKDLKINVAEEAELAKELDTAFNGNRSPAIIDDPAQIEEDTELASDSISSQSAGPERNQNRKNRSR